MKILGLFFYIIVLLMPAQVSLASSKSGLQLSGRVPFKTSLEYRARPVVRLNVHRESDYYVGQQVIKNSSSNISYKYIVIGRN